MPKARILLVEDNKLQAKQTTDCLEAAGYRVTDVLIDFYDGKMHPVDSKDIAFQIAGRLAFREGMKQAKPALLEPIMNVEVYAPDAIEVEFVTASGRTQALVTLPPSAVREVGDDDLVAVRPATSRDV